MPREMLEFIRDVGGPVMVAEMVVLAVVLPVLLFWAGVLLGDI
jgi:hypothetical protein